MLEVNIIDLDFSFASAMKTFRCDYIYLPYVSVKVLRARHFDVHLAVTITSWTCD
tara:strand:+ start:455 stop:619 length:165 start_codon:yes stop_codon:yes gene_type:complete